MTASILDQTLAERPAPSLVTEIPGPRSRELARRDRARRITGMSALAGLSGLALHDGQGCSVRDVDGNVFLDLSGGAGTAIIGHTHPEVVSALKREMNNFLHAYDYASEIRTELFDRLAALLPPGLDHFQMHSGGAETVEAAVRLAREHTGRSEVVSLYRAYHGKTMGAMALSGSRLRRQAGGVPAGYFMTADAHCYRCPLGLTYPSCDVACARLLQDVLDQHTSGQVAAVVVEPVQGAGGVIVPPPEYLGRLQALCRERGILLIADEILTAPGRTGRLWACEHFGLRPDIMTLSKGIGSGYPVGIVATTAEIASAGSRGTYGTGTTTFGGNSPSAAAVLATLAVIERDGLVENAARIGGHLRDSLIAMRDEFSCIGDVRGLGLLLGVEFVRDRRTREPIGLDQADRLFREIVGRGLLVASAGPIIRLTPPLVLSREQADRGLALLADAIRSFEAQTHIG